MWRCSKVVIDRPVILFKYPCGRNRRMVGPSGVGDNTKVKRRMIEGGRKRTRRKQPPEAIVSRTIEVEMTGLLLFRFFLCTKRLWCRPSFS